MMKWDAPAALRLRPHLTAIREAREYGERVLKGVLRTLPVDAALLRITWVEGQHNGEIALSARLGLSDRGAAGLAGNVVQKMGHGCDPQ
jgi:hypothetical protein